MNYLVKLVEFATDALPRYVAGHILEASSPKEAVEIASASDTFDDVRPGSVFHIYGIEEGSTEHIAVKFAPRDCGPGDTFAIHDRFDPYLTKTWDWDPVTTCGNWEYDCGWAVLHISSHDRGSLFRAFYMAPSDDEWRQIGDGLTSRIAAAQALERQVLARNVRHVFWDEHGERA